MDPDVDPRIPEPVSASVLPEFEDAPLEGRERIDRGGDADVYLSTVEYQGDSYRLAVKQPRFQGTLGSRRLENFEAEVEVWNTLGDHDNIVSVYGWGTRPEPWLALEYMDAGTLKSKLGTVDLAEALWLAGRIAEGVHYGHRNGIAHLDLKPSNILCRETGPGMWTYPKIADWGLAKLLLEGSSVTDGYSSQYAAPEQRAPDRFGEPDDITDIYQLGAVVYSLLTGDPPETRSITDTGTESFRTPDPPSHWNPAIPSVVDEAVLTALEPVPSDRYDSVVTLRNELDRGLIEVLDDADETTGDALKIEDSADISPESTDNRIKDNNPKGKSNMPETGVSNRSASVEKTAGQPSNIDSEFICPNCHSTWVLSSSIRSSDVCPECHNGYVVEQNRQDGDTAGAVDRERGEERSINSKENPISFSTNSIASNTTETVVQIAQLERIRSGYSPSLEQIVSEASDGNIVVITHLGQSELTKVAKKLTERAKNTTVTVSMYPHGVVVAPEIIVTFMNSDFSPDDSIEKLGVTYVELSKREDYSNMAEILSAGNIVISAIGFMNPQHQIVKDILERLNQFTNEIDGDIIIVESDVIIATPSAARISRSILNS